MSFMTEEAYRKWDVAAKIIAPILTVAGILVGVWQFSAEQREQLKRQSIMLSENDKLDFKRRMWEKQLEVYTKVNNIVGKIATSNQNDKKLLAEIDNFYSLYWGDMIYVKDEAVEKAMIDFHLEIQDFLKRISDKDRLKLRANDLVEACRQSSKRSWFDN